MDVRKETISIAVLAPGKDRVEAWKIRNTPLESNQDDFAREVLPHVPDSWADESFRDDKD